MEDEFEEIVEVTAEDVTELDDGPFEQADESALPAPGENQTLERPAPALPAIQTAAVAATGFLAGAAAVTLLRRHGARRMARTRRRAPMGFRFPSDGLPVAATRTYLVRVHVLSPPPE